MRARRRLLGLLLRRQSGITRLAVWIAAVAGPVLLAAVLLPLRARLGLAGYLFAVLLVVIVVALLGGLRPALTAVVASFVAGAFWYAPPYDTVRIFLRLDNVPLVGFVVVGATIAILVHELTQLAEEQTESRSELAASRVRIVTAADQTRRRIERDLHDGAQQRLVTLGLELRAAQKAVPGDLPALGGELGRVADGLAVVMDELREMARGLHPAILAEGGLAPALRALARRSAVPVQLAVTVDERLPDPIEVAAYYVVSEALANAAKHAHASAVHVEASTGDGILRVTVADDGAGGADPRRGSGLVGLTDRVQALGGTITVKSPPSAGTELRVELPLAGAQLAAALQG